MARRRRGGRVRRFARRVRHRAKFPPVLSLLHLYPIVQTVIPSNGKIMGQPNIGNISGAMSQFQTNGPAAGLNEFVDLLGWQYIGYAPATGRKAQFPVNTYVFHGAVYVLQRILRKVGVNRFTSKFGVRIA
jgi:hypothetical protein